MKNLFTAKNIAGMAVFAAISYLISLLEIPLFPAAQFLKLDFSNVFIMLSGFMYGPIAAVMVGLVKELLSLIGSSSFGVGQIANFVVILVYVLPPSIVYLFKKGLPFVVVMLALSCILQTVTALIVNRFVTFPLYGIEDSFGSLFWILVAFNLIKSVSVSVLTVILYKKVSYLFKKINLQNSPKDI